MGNGAVNFALKLNILQLFLTLKKRFLTTSKKKMENSGMSCRRLKRNLKHWWINSLCLLKKTLR